MKHSPIGTEADLCKGDAPYGGGGKHPPEVIPPLSLHGDFT